MPRNMPKLDLIPALVDPPSSNTRQEGRTALGYAYLCTPLRDWRPDVPDLWPFCVQCGGSITVGRRYVVTDRNKVFCVPCAVKLGLAQPKHAEGGAP